MSLKNIDMDSVLRRLADKRIEEAMAEGKFSNLPGAGKPIDLEPLPADEGARLAWWALRIMKQNDFTPDEVRWRKQLDGLRDELAAAMTDRRVKALVAQINGLVRQINTLGTNALKTGVSSVTLDIELKKLRNRLSLPSTEESQPNASPVPTPGLHAGPTAVVVCSNVHCRKQNPPAAGFCSRCGVSLADLA